MRYADDPGGTKRIRGPELLRIRARHFRWNPLCVLCDARGRVRLATELDHILPLHKGGAEHDSNRQGLCAECHAAKTRQDKGQKERPEYGPDGYPTE